MWRSIIVPLSSAAVIGGLQVLLVLTLRVRLRHLGKFVKTE